MLVLSMRGEKPNVIAGRAEARFGVRPPPEMDPRGTLRRLADLALDATFEERFVAPPLRPGAQAEAKRLGLALGMRRVGDVQHLE